MISSLVLSYQHHTVLILYFQQAFHTVRITAAVLFHAHRNWKVDVTGTKPQVHVTHKPRHPNTGEKPAAADTRHTAACTGVLGHEPIAWPIHHLKRQPRTGHHQELSPSDRQHWLWEGGHPGYTHMHAIHDKEYDTATHTHSTGGKLFGVFCLVVNFPAPSSVVHVASQANLFCF